MRRSAGETSEKIRLLIIDDNKASCLVQVHSIEEEFGDAVEVTTRMVTPTMPEILGYDGVILDERLIAESGLELARRIHERNWRIPLMIMTTLRPSDPLFEKAHEVVDYVATKGDPLLFIRIMHAFLRQIRRIRAAPAGSEAANRS